MEDTLETRSQCSNTTRSSQRSTASMIAAKARAKAEAARTQASYAQKEADLMKAQAYIEEQKQKAAAEAARKTVELTANLQTLRLEREAAAAIAEAEVLEAAADEDFRDMHYQNAYKDDAKCTTTELTADIHQDTGSAYPTTCSVHHLKTDSGEDMVRKATSKEINGYESRELTVPHTPKHIAPGFPSYPHAQSLKRESYMPSEHPHHQSQPNGEYKFQPYDSRAYSTEFQPRQTPPQQTTRINDTSSSATTDLAKYLIRRELVSSGLLRFDDKPENYWAWRTSFLSSTEDLNLTPREELDLLCKWLGPNSSEQAKRIRAVCIHNATSGVSMVWQRLQECYGSAEAIENALLNKLDDFTKITKRENHRLRELGDLLMELDAARRDGFLPGLNYLDTSRGINPIVQKLPYHLHERWVSSAARYKDENNSAYPSFSVFVKFVCDQAKTLNDPSFAPLLTGESNIHRMERLVVSKPNFKTTVSVRKTETLSCPDDNLRKGVMYPDKQCPLHNKPHPLKRCRGFRNKSLDERKAFLKEKNICYKCCSSTTHVAKDCTENVQCRECSSSRHPSALHPGPAPWNAETYAPPDEQGGEHGGNASPAVISKCTEICGNANTLRSCAKILLVKVYPSGQKEKAVKIYAVFDEQSNKSLAKTEFFELFDIKTDAAAYMLKTCSGVMETAGRRANNFIVESIDGKISIPLPTLIECDMLPDDRSEIPTPEVARPYAHLKQLADKIPALDTNAAILILLGRDIPRAHKVRETRNGPHNAPYAQRLDLGWVIIGEVCLGGAHVPTKVSAYRTCIMNNGRTSLFEPCKSRLHIKEAVNPSTFCNHALKAVNVECVDTDILGEELFKRTSQDDKPTFSVDEKLFLEILDKEMFVDESNSWTAPLPFKPTRRRLPNNRAQAAKRFTALCRMLDKRKDMHKHFFDFMRKTFESGHAEPAPLLNKDQECWYLPMFGVYHPRKPGQIRVVFDSSATHEGVSLNSVLLSGPDLNNTLLGVLLRFRKEPVAVTADIEQMFYCFTVREDHRNFLRFLWFEDNNPDKPIKEYRMTVHVFGNSPSPAIAIYGLKRAAWAGQEEYSHNAKQFVRRNFYVDDGLTSFSSDAEAIHVLKETKQMLAESNIRLHKIASNSPEVMKAFPSEERAKELKDLDLGADPLPLQRSLGLSWDLQKDCFTFLVSREEKPFTRRGILSTVNSIYDPLGFAAPISMQGKALIREMCSENCDWDAPLPADKEAQWRSWKTSLLDLEKLQIPRQYIHTSLHSTHQRELCVFADASTLAISAVAYLRALDEKRQVQVGFCMGKSKLAPRQPHTIPRLELCAAVLAVELADMLLEELDVRIQKVKYYTDSRVVLGYINNTSRRFYVYVANRVARIRKSTHPTQWYFVNTQSNPADHGTRPVPVSVLFETSWLTGPVFLRKIEEEASIQPDSFELIEPASDVEVRPEIATFITKVATIHLGAHRFARFSSWRRLIYGVAKLITKIRSAMKASREDKECVNELTQAKTVIIRSVQEEAFEEELKSLSKGELVPKHSPCRNLGVFLDSEGLVRIGGRLSSAEIPWDQRHPMVIPKKHHIAILLVLFYHEQVAHQGRHITEGAIRSAGLWVLGGKSLVSSVIHKCITCRRLRGKMEQQKMSDIPADRLTQAPPFSHVGLDVFGPWSICIRRTRGGVLENKRWAVMFTCLVTRAVHIEVIESLTTSSFINALRRFIALRGPAKLFRSDRGTNFVGACKELQFTAEDPELQSYFQNEGCTWKFNPPHSSHMGGVWERMIGIARRILDAMLLKVHTPSLSHEVLITLMAEVTAIMNGRPLVPVSSDPEQPDLLTPGSLLTQKIDLVSPPPGDFDPKDLHRKQWKQVQCLANSFWKRWRQEYLTALQPRRKWQAERPNLKIGDVVLLKDNQAARNQWPIGLIVNTFPGPDNRVRKVEVRVVKGGNAKVYTRPVSEVVLLVKEA